jgi:hypothetical protein
METMKLVDTSCIISVVMAALLASNSDAADKGEPEISEISLERTQCFGTCPSYQVTIRSDGTVEYEGKEFVTQKGNKRSKISRSDVLKLQRKAREIGLFALKDEYYVQEVGNASVAVSDLPSQIIIAKGGDRTKRIEDYLGAPRRLKEFEELIETVANTSAWTGHRADPQLSDIPYYDSFPVNRELKFRGLIQEMGKLNGKPRYMLSLVKNTLEFDLHMPPSLDLSQFAGCVVDVTGTIKEDGGQFFEVSEMHRIRRYNNADQKNEPDAQSKSKKR